MSQLPLIDAPPDPPAHRVRGLAGVLAGYTWPDRGSFEKLRKPQQEATLAIARDTLVALERAREENP